MPQTRILTLPMRTRQGLFARILAAVDCFDALISGRPYRSAYSIEDALGKMAAESGIRISIRLAASSARYRARCIGEYMNAGM